MKKGFGHSGRIPSLDGLRAVSILLVIFGHLGRTRYFPHCLDTPSMVANLGVRVFFVISGFLITTLLLNELNLTGRISLKNFYLRRVLRIFPASYTFILFIFAAASAGFIVLHPHDLIHAATYTTNYAADPSWYIGHLWSLSVEEQFYLMWPLTLVVLGRRRGLWFAGILCLLIPVLRVGFVWLPAAGSLTGRSFETVSDSIAVGCLLAGVGDWLSHQAVYNRILSSRLFAVIPVAALSMAVFPLRPRYQYPVGETLMNVAVALCLHWSMRNPSHAVGKVLNARPAAFLGVLSYSLYLWQQLFLNRASQSLWCSFPLNACCVMAAALGSYFLVEKPFLRLKRRFESEPVKGTAVRKLEEEVLETTPTDRVLPSEVALEGLRARFVGMSRPQ